MIYLVRKSKCIINEQQIRGHSCLSDNQIEVGTCRNDVVAFDVWGEWSGCSATCNEGIRTRTRTNLCGVSLESETQVENMIMFIL